MRAFTLAIVLITLATGQTIDEQAVACFWTSTFSATRGRLQLQSALRLSGFDFGLDVIHLHQCPLQLRADGLDPKAEQDAQRWAAARVVPPVRVRWWIASSLLSVTVRATSAMHHVLSHAENFTFDMDGDCAAAIGTTRFVYDPTVSYVPTLGEGFWLLVGCVGALIFVGTCVYACKFTALGTVARRLVDASAKDTHVPYAEGLLDPPVKSV
jgi:hypothetical protein